MWFIWVNISANCTSMFFFPLGCYIRQSRVTAQLLSFCVDPGIKLSVLCSLKRPVSTIWIENQVLWPYKMGNQKKNKRWLCVPMISTFSSQLNVIQVCGFIYLQPTLPFEYTFRSKSRTILILIFKKKSPGMLLSFPIHKNHKMKTW